MIIRHTLPKDNYTKIHRRVFTDHSLSDGAFRLYCYLCTLKNGASVCDEYIVKAMKISIRNLARRKKELKDKELILVDQVGPRVYVIYIGYPGMTAFTVKSYWEAENEDKV